MTLPRGLTADEEAAWAKLASSVEPFDGRMIPVVSAEPPAKKLAPEKKRAKPVAFPPKQSAPIPRPAAHPLAKPVPRMARRIGGHTLDAQWDRKLKAGEVAPDYTLDLHDHYLDAAHTRLESGMMQARAMGARLVLVITGRPRPVDAADRASKRGVIRAKLLDWLAAGDHADAIAAVRKAHRRHGGEGALYIVLRRAR